MNNQAELVSVGSELLCGQTVNTHARDLGAALASLGLRLVRDTTIPDEVVTIAATLEAALQRVPLLFVSGGLGPTSDDLTRSALALAFARPIVPSAQAQTALAQRYASFGRTLTPAAERQALVLEGADVLLNPAGAAPGQRIDAPNGRTVFVLPGPPHEFNALLSDSVLPWLRRHYAGIQPRSVRLIYTAGLGESDLVTQLEACEFNATPAQIGFYPQAGRVLIRLEAEARHTAELDQAEATLRQLFSKHLAPAPQGR